MGSGRRARRVCASSNEPPRGQRRVFAPLRLRSGALAARTVRRRVRADAAPRGFKTPALTRKQGRGTKPAGDPLIASCETLGAGGPQPRMPTSSELRFAMNSGATPAPTPRFTKMLADHLTCNAQQALRRCRSHSPSGHQPTPANLFRDGRAGELDRAVGRLLLVTVAEVRLEDATLRRHRLREVRMPSEATAIGRFPNGRAWGTTPRGPLRSPRHLCGSPARYGRPPQHPRPRCVRSVHPDEARIDSAGRFPSGRVGPAHCCAGPPSEPGRARFRAPGSGKPWRSNDVRPYDPLRSVEKQLGKLGWVCGTLIDRVA